MSDNDSNAMHYERLGVFIGRWSVKGQQHDCPFGPAAPISATDTYEWFDGKKFVVHHFNGKVGTNAASCIEIMGYDPVKLHFRLHTFYNNGMSSDWHATESRGTWVIVSDAGQPMKIKCTSAFSADKKSIASKWEYSKDAKSWTTFWDVQSTKQA